ncbi:MAG TPA: DapH/DapD/GlmU-related protein [Acidimicrobiales bacterium]|nr:DapH/DapD/GlmU-related protein [Acidimicrobiales bacterium]
MSSGGAGPAVTGPVVIDGDWWPHPVPANVASGPRSWLYSSFAFLHAPPGPDWKVRIGEQTGVYDGTVFDLGPDAEVTIGSFGTLVGPCFSTNGKVTIGDYPLISLDVLIADHPAARPHCGWRDRPPSDPVTIGDDVWIGAGATIIGGVSFGDGVVVGAGAVVDFDVPDYAMVAGNPGHVVGWARPGSPR